MTDSISVPAAELRRALTAVLPHAGADDTLPSLTCVWFETVSGWLYLVATDRYSMAAARIHVPAGCQDQSAALPGRSARALRQMLKGSGPDVAALNLAAGSLSVAAGKRWSVTWTTVDAAFPDWRSMLHKILTAEPCRLAEHGIAGHLIARLADGSGRGDVLGFQVTSGKSHSGGESPVVVSTRGDWFVAALMPARCADEREGRPVIGTWAKAAAPAAEAVTGNG